MGAADRFGAGRDLNDPIIAFSRVQLALLNFPPGYCGMLDDVGRVTARSRPTELTSPQGASVK